MFRQYLGKSHASHPLIVKEPHTLPRRRTESIGGRGRQLLFAGSLLLAHGPSKLLLLPTLPV